MKVTGQPRANAVRLWISCPARKCYLSRVLRSRTSLEHGCASSLNTANHVNVEENMAFGLYVMRDGSVMVAYGQRHIPISGAQYKANGYKPPSKNWRSNHPPSKRAPIVVTSPTRPASPRPSPDRPAHGRRLAARARCRTGDSQMTRDLHRHRRHFTARMSRSNLIESVNRRWKSAVALHFR